MSVHTLTVATIGIVSQNPKNKESVVDIVVVLSFVSPNLCWLFVTAHCTFSVYIFQSKTSACVVSDKKPHRFLGMHITNDGANDVTLYWSENGEKKSLVVPGKGFREYTTLLDPGDEYIYVRAVGVIMSHKYKGGGVYVKPSSGKHLTFLHVNGNGEFLRVSPLQENFGNFSMKRIFK